MDNITLRNRLKLYGENPGPITNTTHQLYLKRLHKLETRPSKSLTQNQLQKSQPSPIDINKEKQMLKSSLLSIQWVKDIDEYESIERKVFLEFDTQVHPVSGAREQVKVVSTIYCLILGLQKIFLEELQNLV